MDKTKKALRDLEKLKALGFNIPDTNTAVEQITQPHRDNIEASREAEAVLDYLSSPKRYKELDCKYCHKRFAVNRSNVAYCSDSCRAKSLWDEYGIRWDFTQSPEKQWYYSSREDHRTNEPLVIRNTALDIANQYLGIPKQTPFESSIPIVLDD